MTHPTTSTEPITPTEPIQSARPRPRLGDRGQAAVELALALPLLAMVLLGAAQIVVVAAHQMAVLHAAREGARAAAVSADPVSPGSAAADAAVPLDPLSIDVAIGGDTVTVSVDHVNSTDVVLIGALLPDVTLHGEVTMMLEPP
jgi:hypothetical protein